MNLDWNSFEIHPRDPFTIARGTTTAYQRVLVRLQDDAGSVEGWGEAAPNAFYGEDIRTVHDALLALGSHADFRAAWPSFASLEEIEAMERHMRAIIPAAGSARAAISAAAHDALGKRLGRPLFELLALNPNTAPPTSFTIAIPESDADLVRRIEDAHSYPILKIKLGTDRDEHILRTVRRAAPRKLLRVDANAAWTVERAAEMLPLLVDHGVELLEQPLPKDDLDGFWRLRDHATIPIIADESCVDSRDLPRLDGAVDGINIKLAKCGGLAEARRMAVEARNRGMRVMLGCMVESSLGITAAAHLAPLVDYADLDGAALLADDPFTGAGIENGMIRLPAGPGLGVQRRD